MDHPPSRIRRLAPLAATTAVRRLASPSGPARPGLATPTGTGTGTGPAPARPALDARVLLGLVPLEILGFLLDLGVVLRLRGRRALDFAPGRRAGGANHDGRAEEGAAAAIHVLMCVGLLFGGSSIVRRLVVLRELLPKVGDPTGLSPFIQPFRRTKTSHRMASSAGVGCGAGDRDKGRHSVIGPPGCRHTSWHGSQECARSGPLLAAGFALIGQLGIMTSLC